MSSRKPSRRSLLGEADLGSWPTVTEIALRPQERDRFTARKNAVTLYAGGASLREIEQITGIVRQVLYALIDRCFTLAPDGRPMGFRALVPYRHIPALRQVKLSKMHAPRPLPGVFHALLSRSPSIFHLIKNLALTGRPDGRSERGEKRLKAAVIHEAFLDACVAQGIHAPMYPFNSKSEGRQSVWRLVRRIRTENHGKSLGLEDPNAAKRMRSRGNGSTETPSRHCYQRIECDGHKIDIECTVEARGLNGEGVVQIPITRLHLIVLIEPLSGAVIGYSIAYGQNYSAADVICAVRNALTPWRPRKLQIQTLKYREGEGLPNGLHPELAYVRWNEFWIDNHAGHLSDYCLTAIEHLVGGVCVFGPVKQPNARPSVEGFFNILEEAGIHRTYGTTGSGPQDKRRTRETKDFRYHLTEELLLDLVDLLIARHNAARSPNSTCSRIEVLKRAATRRTTIFRRVPVRERADLFRHDIFEEARVGLDHGLSVVRFKGGRYWNEQLRLETCAGRNVLIMGSSRDLRRIQVVLDDGSDLGVMEVEQRWRETCHSLQTRKEILRAEQSDSTLRRAADLPHAFRMYTEERAHRSRAEAARLARLRREQAVSDSVDPVLVKEVDFVAPSLSEAEQKAIERATELLQKIGVQYR